MIIDFIENAARYETIHPSFKTAFDYLKQSDKEALDGLIDEEAGVKMFAYKGEGKSKAKSLETFECLSPNGDYNSEKDVRFFNDEPDTYFELQANQFVVFFPEDVHAPMISENDLDKIVVKVLI
jgi:biofilm protein TabA